MKITIDRSLLSLTAFLLLGGAAAAQGGVFDIANSSEREASITADFDGTNFLVGIQGSVVDDSMVGVQFVSPSGALVGGFLSTGRTGGVPLLGFGGGNHLLAWTDDASSPDNHIYGQLISPAGVQGPLIPISQATGDEDVGGVAWGQAAYLVTYYREAQGMPGLGRLYGRLVTSAGVARPEVQISTGFTNYGQGNLNNVASDGSGYLVVWIDGQNDTEVRGRLVGATGSLGAEFSINAAAGLSDQPLSVAFDGTNYLVVWNERTPTPAAPHWDVLGQRVSPAGALVGGVIPVCTAPGDQYAPFVACGAGVSLVSWTELRNDLDGDWACDPGEGSCADVYVRYLDAAGAPMADEWPVVMLDGDQYGSPVAAGAGSFLLVWNDGTFPPPTLGGDVYGMLLPGSGFPDTYCTAKQNSLGCYAAITFSGLPSLTAPGEFRIGCVDVISNRFGLLFYGLNPNTAPFQGGTLCVQPPLQRTPVQNSSGNPPPADCSGVFLFDFNAYLQSGADPSLVVGQPVYAQYWYRDPASSPFPTGLSDALSFQILP